ncbi:MAG: hypothetical protein K1X83_14845 [Oligoflexia bacterium]|nr:hypothetical protein [Oligoflexia bacterium]
MSKGKLTLLLLSATFNFAFQGCQPRIHYRPHGRTTYDNRFAVCHKGKHTLLLRNQAVPAHLAHGDWAGPC